MEWEERINTPYFLIHECKMDKLFNEMLDALHKYWQNGIIGYSFKTNNLPWIIEYMQNKGAWAEVVSSDEFRLARSMGFPYDRIIFNGPVKGKKEFEEAVCENCVINLDSERELRWLQECTERRAKIGLRINFDLESLCPDESQCGADDGRFGFSYETGAFEKALFEVERLGIKLSGIHLHCSSKTRSLNIYRAIAETAVKIVNKYDLSLEYVDIGGGFFGGVSGKPSFEEYFSAIEEIFREEPLLKKTNIIVEPGMSVVGAAVDYVVSVTDVKTTVHNKFVVTDGSRIHIDPLMRKTGYTYFIHFKEKKEITSVLEKQTVCGFTCMENDRFFSLKQEKELSEGDKIVFEKVGAYTMGLSPLFIQFFPPVYRKRKEQISMVRKKCTAEEFKRLGGDRI